MELNYQDYIVFVLVLLAALFAGFKTIKQFTSKDEQAKCTKCGCSHHNSKTNAEKVDSKIPAHFLKNRT